LPELHLCEQQGVSTEDEEVTEGSPKMEEKPYETPQLEIDAIDQMFDFCYI